LVRHFSAALSRSQIFTDPREIDAHAIQIVVADSLERIIDQAVRQRSQFRDERLRSLGDLKPPGASVGRIRRAFDEPRLGKAIDDPAQSDGLDIEPLRELDLPEARLPAQPEQNLPWGAGHAKRSGAAIE